MAALRLAVLVACLAVALATEPSPDAVIAPWRGPPTYPPTYPPPSYPPGVIERRSMMTVVPIYAPPVYPSPPPMDYPLRRFALDTTQTSATTMQAAVKTTAASQAAAALPATTPDVQATSATATVQAPAVATPEEQLTFGAPDHDCKNFHALPAEVGNTDNQRFSANLLFMSRTAEEFDLGRCFKQAGLLVHSLGLKYAGARSGRECWAVWEAPPERILDSDSCQPCANPLFKDNLCGGTGSMTLYAPHKRSPEA